MTRVEVWSKLGTLLASELCSVERFNSLEPFFYTLQAFECTISSTLIVQNVDDVTIAAWLRTTLTCVNDFDHFVIFETLRLLRYRVSVMRIHLIHFINLVYIDPSAHSVSRSRFSALPFILALIGFS